MYKRIIYFLKKIVPYSLFGRFMLIIIIPTVLVQVVATYMFYQRHWSSVSSHMMAALAGEVAMIAYISNNQSHEERDRIHKLTNEYLTLKTTFLRNKQLRGMPIEMPNELKELHNELIKRIFSQVNVSYFNKKQDVKIEIQMAKGVLNIIASRKRFDNPTTYIFILWMTGTASILLIIAIMFSRIQIRSISRLAIVAEKFGKGQEISGFKPEGANEVRKAATAFLKMKERIERQINKRTEMLAGVSHDLRTPLTRMKLQLAMLGEGEDIRDLQHDIVEMEKMIQGYLDFARGEGEENSSDVNVTETIEKMVDSYRNYGSNITLTITQGIIMQLRVNAFKRVLTNVIDNGLRYGQQVMINVMTNANYLIITVDDDGEGIPEDQRELVFKPFYRIDSARNLDKGGVGLGLAIARDIISGHGGTIALGDSPAKGLRVVIRIPL